MSRVNRGSSKAAESRMRWLTRPVPEDDSWFDAMLRAFAESDGDGPGPERIYVDAERECPT